MIYLVKGGKENFIMRQYYSLHAHSEYSNVKVIDSINRYERSINYAWDLGLSGVAMTEHDCLSGSIKYIKAFKKKIEEEWVKLHADDEKPHWSQMAEELQFKPILGNEIYLSEEGITETLNDQWTKEGHPGHFYHLLLLAKDEEGFKQLKELSSAAWKRAWFRGILRTPTYPSDLFKFVKGGHLVCSTACLGGFVAQTVLKYLVSKDEALLSKLDNHLRMMQELFGKGNFFIEIQPNPTGDEQINFNKFVLDRYWGKYPFIFTTDAHYLNDKERSIHKAFLNSKSSKDREVDDFYSYAYIMSEEEVAQHMPYVSSAQIAEMSQNSRNIMGMVKCYELTQPKVIAKVEYEHQKEYENDIEVFADVDKETYPYFYYYLHTSNPADHYLMELIAHGYINKITSEWNTKLYYDRLEEELGIIKEVGDKIGQSMSNYFITISKMVDLMWEAGSLVGPSRGSAGASLINYLTDVTQMDPIQMDLPFMWRFMHPSRPDYPDKQHCPLSK